MFADYQLRGRALDVLYCSGIRIEILNLMFQKSNISRSVSISGALGLGPLAIHILLLICFHSVPEYSTDF